MNWLADIVRPEVLALRAYRPARYEADCVRLNANEAPWRAPGDDTARGLNRYPPPRPQALEQALAGLYGVQVEQVLVTRGSSEAIDLLVRSFCTAGRDSVVICPPTFGMYEVYAQVQGARVRRVPLQAEREFALDEPGVAAALDAGAKLLFLCSPNNPTGNCLDAGAVDRLCGQMAGRGLVVIDEAYVDFAASGGLLGLLAHHPHVVVLRTLSKARALAGIRCGALLGRREVVELVARVMPPYGIPTPSLEAALRSLQEPAESMARERVRWLQTERERLAAALAALPNVRRLYPSEANFLLAEVADAPGMQAAAQRAGILVRRFSGEPALADCLRISVGTAEQNDALLASLAGTETGT